MEEHIIKLILNIMGKKITLIILILTLSILFLPGCSISQLWFPETQENQELTSIPEVEIDERELAIIENIDENMETNYQAQKESAINPDVADPFKPYYTQQAQEQENTIRLDQIYSQDGVEYAEIKFNEFDYKLTETDVFAEVYQVQAINENSVVLLKGDEIITLVLGQRIDI